ENPKKLYQQLSEMRSNEELLYSIIERGIGFGKINEHPYRPLHGFHLGWLRDSNDGTNYFAPDKPNKQRVEYYTLKRELNKYFHDALFNKMLYILPNPEILKLERLVKN